ncbi:Sensory box/GGDEF family protein [hydrothermal vent metagenome]|uniref:Sensory box/GGDEF family protein n=1 Tax=hydrothermal vent metagenome TaxID=652676 RepID=A0A1W1D5R1_9ZZZZ
MMKNIKIKLLFFVLFVIANGVVFYITKMNDEQKVQMVLDSSVRDLQISYELLLQNQKINANAAYIETTELTRGFTKIMKKAQVANASKKRILRSLLHKLLKKKYQVLQTQGVLQYSFYLPNNEAFLRMHNVEDFGDNVAKVRPDVALVNKIHKPIRGFFSGKTTQSFRNVYPIFDSHHNYLGVMEVSFSSDSLPIYLEPISKRISYFLVKRDIFDSAKWQNKNIALDYIDSGAKKELSLNFNASHSNQKCIIADEIQIPHTKKMIEEAIKRSKPFAVESLADINSVKVVAFYPIINEGDSVASAWIVSQGKNTFLYDLKTTTLIIRVVAFILFLIIFVAFYKLIVTKRTLEKEHQLVSDVLNSSDNIIFATNLKDINFSNKNFLRFFDVKNNKRFMKKVKNDIFSIFMPGDKSLHRGLLQEDETFIDLVERTPKEERVVTLLDENNNKKLFQIAIFKASFSEKSDAYIIVLSDLEKVKAKEEVIQQKVYRDTLTGLYNRQKFNEMLESELKRDERNKRDINVIFFQINHLEQIEQKHGSLVVDAIIMEVTSRIQENLRDVDLFARLDKDIFGILLFDISLEDAKAVCAKLQDALQNLSHPVAGEIEVTVVTLHRLENETLADMYVRGEELLKQSQKDLPILNVID